MKERPILFSTAMIQAIMSGRKTMTRRVIKPKPAWVGDPSVPFKTQDADPKGIINCPYGKPCDRLWVMETTCIAPKNWADRDYTCIQDFDGDWRHVFFKADGHPEDAMRQYGLKWTPSIHVPKWAARIWLKVTGVRVERLQEISEDDCISEGIDRVEPGELFFEFQSLWDSINKSRGYSWDKNPWVWCVTFERVDRPQAAKEE